MDVFDEDLLKEDDLMWKSSGMSLCDDLVDSALLLMSDHDPRECLISGCTEALCSKIKTDVLGFGEQTLAGDVPLAPGLPFALVDTTSDEKKRLVQSSLSEYCSTVKVTRLQNVFWPTKMKEFDTVSSYLQKKCKVNQILLWAGLGEPAEKAFFRADFNPRVFAKASCAMSRAWTLPSGAKQLLLMRVIVDAEMPEVLHDSEWWDLGRLNSNTISVKVPTHATSPENFFVLCRTNVQKLAQYLITFTF